MTSVGDIAAAIQYGFTESATTIPVGPKFLRITDIQNGQVDWSNVPYCKCPEFEKYKLKPNDIVFARTGATTGKSFIIGDCPDAVFASYLIRLRVKENVLAKYVYYFFQSKNYWNQINQGVTGSTQGGFNASKLAELQIPIVSFEEQKRIVKRLDEIDIAVKKRKVANSLSDQFLQSTFLSMFGNPSSNEKNWERGTIRKVVSEVKYGTSKPAEENGNYPYLRMNNIDYNGNWDLSSLKFINLENSEREKYLLQNGDLVFNRTNSKELVGKTAVYNFNEEMAIAGYLIRVRTNERANPYYLSAYLNSKHGKSVLFNMCKNIIGMANINAQELQDIEILIPPISLQQKFASIVADTEQLRQKQKQSEIELENLFQALLQKYFD